MRNRKPAFLGAVLVVLVAGCVLLLRPTRTGAFSLSVLGYTSKGDSLVALVAISNRSSAFITFDTWNFTEPPLKIAAQTPSGWNSYEPKYETFEALVVRPGSGAVFGVTLPSGTSRWQASGLIQVATPKRRVLLQLMHWSPVPVHNWLLRHLPPDVRVKSRLFEVPMGAAIKSLAHNEAHALDGGIPHLFHTQRHLPAASDERC